MTEETGFLEKLKKVQRSQGESSLFGCSVRGWIALMFFGTLCFLQIATAYICFKRHAEFIIDNQFWIMASVIVGFYYAKQTEAPPPPGTETKSTSTVEIKTP